MALCAKFLAVVVVAVWAMSITYVENILTERICMVACLVCFLTYQGVVGSHVVEDTPTVMSESYFSSDQQGSEWCLDTGTNRFVTND